MAGAAAVAPGDAQHQRRPGCQLADPRLRCRGGHGWYAAQASAASSRWRSNQDLTSRSTRGGKAGAGSSGSASVMRRRTVTPGSAHGRAAADGHREEIHGGPCDMGEFWHGSRGSGCTELEMCEDNAIGLVAEG